MNRGFTLIELLVVIAIIGMMSSVILGALNSSRSKGANAAIRSTMNNMRSQVELNYQGGPFVGICSDANITKFADAASMAAAGNTTSDICFVLGAGATAYAISVPLKVPEGLLTYWCVDSTGVSAARINQLTSSACPAL